MFQLHINKSSQISIHPKKSPKTARQGAHCCPTEAGYCKAEQSKILQHRNKTHPLYPILKHISPLEYYKIQNVI